MAKPTGAKPELYLVTWEDAYSPPATETISIDELENAKKPLHITTVGWLLLDGDSIVIVAGEDCGDGDYRSQTRIPKAMIREMRPIRKRRTRKLPTDDDASFDHGITGR